MLLDLYIDKTDLSDLNRMYNCDPTDCWDDDPLTGNCTQLVAAGQCETNKQEMMVRCKKSCEFCEPDPLESSTGAAATSTTTKLPPSVMDCTSKPNGNYPDPTIPCSSYFYMCSDEIAYLFVTNLTII